MCPQAEFMEHDEKPLPIDIRLLGALAEKVLCFHLQFLCCVRILFHPHNLS